jgi:hypothetical protein
MIQPRMPSPGILVAVLALVAALAGTAVAGTDATTSAINKKKVKSIAAKQINKLAPGLSVASAETADSADSATRAQNATNATNATNAQRATNATNAQNASNARAVDGNSVVDFRLNGTSPIAERQILDLGGLQLRATCDSALGGIVTLTARTTVNGGQIAAIAEDASATANDGRAFDENLDVGEAFTFPTVRSEGLVRGSYLGGDLRHVEILYTIENQNAVPGNNCVLNGYAIG